MFLIEVIMGYNHLLVELFVIEDSGVFFFEGLQGYHQLWFELCVIHGLGSSFLGVSPMIGGAIGKTTISNVLV